MDWLQFITTIIGALAWPAAIVALVLILRSPLGNLLRDLSRFRYKEIEIDFGREVRDLEDRARTAGLQLPSKPARPRIGPPDSSQIIADATRLASEFPEPAVGLAWTAVEHELMQAVMRLAISPDYPLYNAPVKSIDLLYREGYLDPETRRLLDGMRRLRNAAVHPPTGTSAVSPGEAREFIALTEAMTDELKNLDR